MQTPPEVLNAIQPFLVPANRVNPTTPLYTSHGVGEVYIYRIPNTNPEVFVFQSSGTIDCDGVSTVYCNATVDPAYQPDTSFHTSTNQPLDAAVLPYYVLPIRGSPYFDYTNHNIVGGQTALIVYGNSMNYGIFGDENADSKAIGEISYAMASSLAIDPTPSTGGIESGVTYIIFTGTSNVCSPIENHTTAISIGESALNTMLTQIGTGGGGGGLTGGCDPVTCPIADNYCLMGTCIPKRTALYAGVAFSALTLLSLLK